MSDASADFEALGMREWPMRHMAVGEVITLAEADFPNASGYVHVYGRSAGKKFQTRRDKANGLLYVKRIK